MSFAVYSSWIWRKWAFILPMPGLIVVGKTLWDDERVNLSMIPLADGLTLLRKRP